MPITNQYIILIANIIVGFIIMFLAPKIMVWVINFRRNKNIATIKSGEKYWEEFVFKYRILFWIGLLWIAISIFLFIKSL